MVLKESVQSSNRVLDGRGEPRIIYECENFLAVNKPAGMLTHPVRIGEKKRGGAGKPAPGPHRETALTDWLLKRYPEIANVGDDPAMRPGIVHRLDRDTSGILLVARNQKYFEYLKSLFQSRQIKKTYFALVFGVPREKEGTIDAPIGVKNGTVKRSVRGGRMIKPAVTNYRVKKIFSFGAAQDRKISLLEIVPVTGRTHQIRVHLASIGNPVAGDRLYGKKNQPSWAHRLMLHACSLEFPVVQGKRIKLEAETPFAFPAE